MGEEQEHRSGESSEQDQACGRGKKAQEVKSQESGGDRGPSFFLRAIREKHKYFQSVFSQGLNRFHRVFIAAPF